MLGPLDCKDLSDPVVVGRVDEKEAGHFLLVPGDLDFWSEAPGDRRPFSVIVLPAGPSHGVGVHPGKVGDQVQMCIRDRSRPTTAGTGRGWR